MANTGAIRSFLMHQQRVLKRPFTTIRTYARALKLFNPIVSINKDPRRATPAHVQQFVEEMADKDMAATTIKVRVAALSAFFEWAIGQGIADRNPAKGVALPKPPKLLPRSLDYRTVVAPKIDAVGGNDFFSLRDRAILEMGFAVAARVSDLAGMNWRDLNLKNSRVKIHGKGDREDLVNFGIMARAALSRYLKIRHDRFGLEDEALFLNDDGKRLSTIGRIVKTRTGHSPHVFFRHSGAVAFLERGASIEDVRAHLRHNSILTTSRYIRVTDDRLTAAYHSHYPRALGEDHITTDKEITRNEGAD